MRLCIRIACSMHIAQCEQMHYNSDTVYILDIASEQISSEQIPKLQLTSYALRRILGLFTLYKVHWMLADRLH